MSGSKLSEDSKDVRAEGAGDHMLGLTVHSLPEPGVTLAEDVGRTRSGRWKMLLVAAICAAPVIASYFTYYVIRPDARRNFGELIEPQRPLPDVLAVDLEGKVSNLRDLKHQWLLVSVGSADCNDDCVQRLYLQRQLREVLGKDKERLDRVWLIHDSLPVRADMRPGLEEATVLRVPAAELDAWLSPATGHSMEQHLYLVDPLGNWMMRFPANLDLAGAGKAKRDLERLMRASSSWDKEGR